MGKKSEKKVKSERINALRKQYDAFLEEDKKRKERNEYILGRLDNMRYSSTAVQIRHKPIAYGDVMPVINCGAYRPEQFEKRDVTPHREHQINRTSNQNLQVPRNYLDNTSLLKEISKKYILIPKLRSSLVDDYVGVISPQSLPPIAVSSPQTNFTGNEDWKSKYDILDQLKKKEKEEQADKYANDELYPVKEKQTICKNDAQGIINSDSNQGHVLQESSDNYALQGLNTKELTTKYEQDAAEKDETSDKGLADTESLNIEQSKIINTNDADPTTVQPPAYTFVNPNIDYDDNQSQNQNLANLTHVEGAVAANCHEQNIVIETNYPIGNIVAAQYTTEVTNNTEKHINVEPPQEEPYVQYDQPIETEQTYPDPNVVYLDPDDYSPIEVLDPSTSTMAKEIHKEPNNTTDVNDAEVLEYPVEMLNAEQFTPNNGVTLIDGQNINPIYLSGEDNVQPVYENEPQTVDENKVDPQDNSDIEAFEAEQKMFYPEETTDYAYDQQQENVTNPEYANEQAAQDYTYYESPTAQLEQEYPVEVNEHEESTTRYDQSYEQQYAVEYQDQQYAQPEGYDQTQQDYVQPTPTGYDQSDQQQYVYDGTEQQYQDYQYTQPDQDTVQNVEESLDNEQGYIEQQHYELPAEQNSETDNTANQDQPSVKVAAELKNA